MKRPARPPQYIPEPKTLTLPPKDYQPTKAELEEEFDMPGMTDEEIQRTFFRPFKIVRDSE